MANRYDNHSGSGTGGSSNSEFDDQTIKLQKYATLNLTGDRITMAGTQYGDRLIANFEDVSVIDGILMQRNDDPDTWKLFGFGDRGFNVGEDGLIYEAYDADAEEFSGQMSAEDILTHPRVQGMSETFGQDTYFYTPVGVVVEANQDIALNDEIGADEIEVGSTADDRDSSVAIEVGEGTMFLNNKSWTRTLAKLLTETGNDIIATEENDDGDERAVTDSSGWLTKDEVDLREELEGREMELFIIEEEADFDDSDETVKYTTPILLDVTTGERITLDNDAEDSESETQSEAEPVAADGGNTTPDGVPQELNELIDYFVNSQDGDVTADELEEFGETEVENPDDVDWQAAADEAARRAEE